MKRMWTDGEIKGILQHMQIVEDTREQVCGHIEQSLAALHCPIVREKLDVGDYTARLPWVAFGSGYAQTNASYTLERDIVIERKANLDELCGNLTVDRRRFEAEFLRAKAQHIKVFLLIEEASVRDVFAHNYRSQMSPKSLWASLLAWQIRYDVSLTFCPASESGRIIHDILYYWLRETLQGGTPC